MKPNVVIVTELDPHARIVTAELITPLRATEYTEDLQPKPRPWRFDRTADGRVVLRGRWLLGVFEAIRDDPDRPETERAMAAGAVLHASLADTPIPPGAIVIEHAIRRGDETITCEMLMPPVTFRVELPGT
jgi:hypothetical protein